jgi:hypothetical protein
VVYVVFRRDCEVFIPNMSEQSVITSLIDELLSRQALLVESLATDVRLSEVGGANFELVSIAIPWRRRMPRLVWKLMQFFV